LPWRQLPLHRDSGAVQLLEPSGALDVAWQSTPPDALRPDRPDQAAGRIGSWQACRDGDTIVVGAGAFVRFRLSAWLRGDGGDPPRLRTLRLIEH
jgi:hypothetical protein